PGPDLGYHAYLINHPEYFAQSGDNNARKRVTASMLSSSAGAYYDRAPEFSMLCLDVDGATIAFYTARTLQPHTIVRFDFSRPIPPSRPRPPPSAPQEPASEGGAVGLLAGKDQHPHLRVVVGAAVSQRR